MKKEQKEFIDRVKLLMEYSLEKTYSENASKFLVKEQSNNNPIQLIKSTSQYEEDYGSNKGQLAMPIAGQSKVDMLFQNNGDKNVNIVGLPRSIFTNAPENGLAYLVSVVNFRENKNVNLPFSLAPKEVLILTFIVFDTQNWGEEKSNSTQWMDELVRTYPQYLTINDASNESFFDSERQGIIDLKIQIPQGNNNQNTSKIISFTFPEIAFTESSVIAKTNLELASKRKSTKVNLPNGKLSPGGYDVPEGFSPFAYDLFLYELWKFFGVGPKEFGMESIGGENQTCIKYWNDLVPDDVKDSIGGKDSSFLKRAWEDIKDVFKLTPNECEESVQKILDVYYNEKFPQGTMPELAGRFQQEFNQVNKRIEDFKNSHKSSSDTGKKTDTGLSFKYERLSDEEKKEYDKLIEEKLSIEQNYGYDDRSGFDKFMDSGPGMLTQIIAAIGLSLIPGGQVEAGAIGWGLIAEVLFNSTMAFYYYERGKTFDAFLWFAFSFIGKLHNLYEKVWASMGDNALKVFSGGKSSFESTASNISKKLLNSGIEIKTYQDYMLFKSTLTPTESFLLTHFMRQDPNTVKNVIVGMSKAGSSVATRQTAYQTLKGGYKQVPWYKANKLLSGVGRGGTKLTLDFYLISVLREKYQSLVAFFKSKGYNIDLGLGERREHFLHALEEQGVTNADLQNFLSNLQALQNKTTNIAYNSYLSYLTNLIKEIDVVSHRDGLEYDKNDSIESAYSEETNQKVELLKNQQTLLQSQLDSVANGLKIEEEKQRERLKILDSQDLYSELSSTQQDSLNDVLWKQYQEWAKTQNVDTEQPNLQLKKESTDKIYPNKLKKVYEQIIIEERKKIKKNGK